MEVESREQSRPQRAVGNSSRLARGRVRGSKPSDKAESVVSRDAVRAWPVVFDENGRLAKPPAGSKHRDAIVATEDGKPAKRHRRTSGTLAEQVADLAARGMVTTAIADALNISDRRTKQILRSVLQAAA